MLAAYNDSQGAGKAVPAEWVRSDGRPVWRMMEPA